MRMDRVSGKEYPDLRQWTLSEMQGTTCLLAMLKCEATLCWIYLNEHSLEKSR